MSEASEKRNKLLSFFLALLLHGVIAAILILTLLTTPDPPLTGGEGMVVNLGYVDESTGEIQPMAEDFQPENIPQETYIDAVKSNQDVFTQTNERTIDVETGKEAVRPVIEKPVVEKRDSVVVTEEQRRPNTALLYKGKTTGSTSQGTSDKGSGDQGSPDGDPDSDYYGKAGVGNTPGTGGFGGGVSANLSNRQPTSLPKPEYKSGEGGKVVVQIMVDKQGTVVNAKAGVKGSTTVNTHLLELARQAAMMAKFTPDASAPDIQTGNIVYNFVPR